MGRFWHIIRVLSWKNMLLMRRKPAVQFFIFASPIILFGLFGGELKPLVKGSQKWSCQRPLTEDSDECSWPPFTPILNNTNTDYDTFPFGMLGENFDSRNFSDMAMGCGHEDFSLYVVDGSGTVQRQLVTSAVTFLNTRFAAQAAAGVGLAWRVTPHYTDEAGLSRAYTEMAATNLSVTGGSGCFFGVQFANGREGDDLELVFRPPYVPGGFRNIIAWDQQTTSLSTRTWHTTEDTPPASPIFISSPRMQDLVSFFSATADQLGDSPGYAFNAFLAIQHAFAVAFADGDEEVESQLLNLQMNRLPYPQYNSDPWAIILLSAAPWAIFLPMMFASSQLVRDMVQEKEDKIKAAMKMMGVQAIHHWTAWFLRGMFSIGLALVVVTIVSVALDLFPVDGSILFVFFILSAVAVTAQTFLVSTLFNKATNAALCAGLGMYVSLLPFQYGVSQQATSNQQIPISDPNAQVAVCVLPGSCIGLGFYSIAGTVVLEDHISWANIMHQPGPQSLSFGQVLGMLFADIVWMSLLAAYIELVFPGDFGVPLHPLFPFIWIQNAMLGGGREPITSPVDLEGGQAENVLPVDATEVIGLHTENLTKVFPARTSGGAAVVAVNNLSLPMVKGQITALLGENGAGKTTTMSMLCGLYPPTDGAMRVEGRDVLENQNYMHKELGVCPQHDVLWKTLTVIEHLYLFGRLKGVPPENLQAACAAMVGDLGLVDKTMAQTKTLSGGQKRRLSCGIALIGGSSVVLLDEPTSGCDPKARRDIWDLLLRHKEGRTILLSTHFMDEADVLGDRVAVMAAGRLVAAGPPSFLKDRFGTGYTLTVSKNVGCESSRVADLVRTHVPESGIKTDIGSELSLRIPTEAAQSFPSLLRDMDAKKGALGIDAFGVTITTMEEVFLAATDLKIDNDIQAVAANAAEPQEPMLSEYEGDDLSEDLPLLAGGQKANGFHDKAERQRLRPTFATQLSALLWKRKLKVLSVPVFTSAQIIVPVLLLCVRLFFASPKVTDDAPARPLNPTDVLYDETAFAEWAGRGGASYLDSTGGGVDTEGLDIPDYVGNYTKGAYAFNRFVQTGLSLDSDSGSLTAWFNGQYYHTVPEAHLLAVNLLFSANASNPTSAKRMSVQNAPMPMTPLESTGSGVSLFGNSMSFAMAALFAFTLFGCVTVYAPVDEQASKHIQLVSGVSYRVYWFAYWVSDYGVSLFVTAAALMTSCLGSQKVFGEDEVAPAAVLLLTFFVGYLCCLYFVSILYSTPANALRFVLIFSSFFGFVPLIVSPIIRLIGYSNTADTITNAFLWLPVFSVSQGLNWVGTNGEGLKEAAKIVQLNSAVPTGCHSIAECCTSMHGLTCTTDYFQWKYPGAGRFVFAHFVHTVGYILLIVIWEEKLAARFLNVTKRFLFKSRYVRVPVEADEDVDAEALRVRTGGADRDEIAIDDVRKAFKLGKIKAVDGVSLGIPSGQCFGLLGVNGAGKTTLFKALTGDHLIDSGSITIAGYNVKTNLKDVQARIGYVPQFDALLGYMTGRQLLSFYAHVKGVRRDKIPETVESLIERLNLKKHAEKPCQTYSGGNKRKLSVASALVGNPGIILLDEPTTGMDPGSRRFLWNVILSLVQDGKSVVLTTHSMEEAEALTQRLCIMVKGRMQCLGSPVHLKNRFGSGYVVRVVCGDPADGSAPLPAVRAALLERFPMLQVEGEHKATLVARIEGDFVLADVFEALEGMKRSMMLADYSATQTSLEQIFLRYANADEEETTFVPTIVIGGAAPAAPVLPGAATHGQPPVGPRFDPMTGKPLQIQGYGAVEA